MAAIVFKNAYDPVHVVPSERGEKTYRPIEYKWDDTAKYMVPYLGKEVDLNAMIQLYKDSTDINSIIARVNAGDISALNVRSGEYIDITDAPKNIHELADFNDRVIASFDNLDPNIKALFGNSSDKFVEAVLNNSINSIIENYKPVKEEVNDNAV